MKPDVHPEYVPCRVLCNCGNTFVTRSTRTAIRTEICSVCHPFYTGQVRVLDTEGRIEKFKKKYANVAAAKK